MGQIEDIVAEASGCPSGLQRVPVNASDPMGRDIDLSSFITRDKEGCAHMDLAVRGAHCAGCVSKIETGLSALDGVGQARLNLSTSRLSVSWDDNKQNISAIIHKLSDLGFGAAPYQVSAAEQETKAQLAFLLRCLAVAAFALTNVMLISIAVWSGGDDMQASTRALFHWVSALIAVPAVLYAGRPFFSSAWSALKNRQTNMDVPISLAMMLALGLSLYETVHGHPDTYFDAALMLVFLLLIGRYLDRRMRARTGEAARKLAAMQITSATRIDEAGRLHTVPASIIEVGDQVFIPSGQRIAVDGEIISGQSQLDTQIVTGETLLRAAGPGEKVYSGMTNKGAPLTVRALARREDSFLSEITRLVEMGEQGKARYIKLADKAARAYVPVVHTAALLTFIGWLIVGGDLRTAAICAIAVLIITCPCALGLAVPAVNVTAAGELFSRGVLIKSGDALERLAKIDRVIFDKTGTLTTGNLRFAVEVDEEIMDKAASLARRSTHPLSRALAGLRPQAALDVTDIQEIAGQGIGGQINGQPVRLGSAKFVGAADREIENGEKSGPSCWFAYGEDAPVRFDFTDSLRGEAGQVVSQLEDMGLKSALLSGDDPQITAMAAKGAGISEAKGGVMPAEKLSYIEDLKESGAFPLMVGDGINDAPALAAATASVSLSSASDISRAAADIILSRDSLADLPLAIETARRAQKRIRENLTFAAMYNFLAIPLAIFGFVNPLIAALAMSASSLLVTLNALRMKARPRRRAAS